MISGSADPRFLSLSCSIASLSLVSLINSEPGSVLDIAFFSYSGDSPQSFAVEFLLKLLSRCGLAY